MAVLIITNNSYSESNDDQVALSIIMYHCILKDSERTGKFVITPAQFEDDVKYLKDNNYNFITVTDVINYVNNNKAKLPKKPIIISFDDGYYNNFLYTYPIIKKYDASFVLSIIGKYTDINKEGEKLSPYYSHVTWDQLKEMNQSGCVELQNHSYDLHKNTKGRKGSLKKKNEDLNEYREFLEGDLNKLQELMEEKLNIRPNTFTYPFGSRSEESIQILKDIGFDAALTCREGINYIKKGDTDTLFHLKRFNRPYGVSSQEYFKGKLENI